MRRQIRPFTIERKRNGRPAQAAETQPLDMPAPPPEPPPMKTHGQSMWAAAEALFSTPVKPAGNPESEGQTAADGSQPNGGRILPSLIEPEAPAPTPSYAVEDAPRRRGRKPGSKNKVQRTPRDNQGPHTFDTAARNIFEFWAQEEDAELPAPAPVAATEAPEAPAVTNVIPLDLRRRGRVDRAELPRGQRWKARLPRFAR